MFASRGGPNIIELDQRARERFAPRPVISADGPNPREIDDAISVTPLPSYMETYRVDVSIANTARLYNRPHVLGQALDKTESRYWINPDGTPGYDPMIDPEEIRRREFKLIEGAKQTLKSGVIFSFTVGEDTPPSELEIRFGMVRVLKNFTYKRFGEKCKFSPDKERYARAAAFIIHHLDLSSASGAAPFMREDTVEGTYDRLIAGIYGRLPLTEAAATIVATKMVATNYLTTKLLDEAGYPLIHRVHKPWDIDGSLHSVVRPNIAYYSLEPGPHDGLGLPSYARFTSPLRRLEDFIGIHIVKLYTQGKKPDKRDMLLLAAAEQRLNQRVAATQFAKPIDVRRAIMQQREDRIAARLAMIRQEEAMTTASMTAA